MLPATELHGTIKAKLSRAYFTFVKLPLILLLIVLGFALEFMVELPFIALLFLGYRADTGINRR
ncbi:MAG: hypothetical protein ACOZF0_23305 [Thermodesulfobacteriota bacterium]